MKSNRVYKVALYDKETSTDLYVELDKMPDIGTEVEMFGKLWEVREVSWYAGQDGESQNRGGKSDSFDVDQIRTLADLGSDIETSRAHAEIEFFGEPWTLDFETIEIDEDE